MAGRGVRRRRSVEEEESYFVSMADMMVGLLFVFIILLLYFALQFRQSTHDISNADDSRTKILTRLDGALRARGLQVSIDPAAGVLRLPEEILFDVGQSRLNANGQKAVAILGSTLASTLPCYTYPRPASCPPGRVRIDSIFIEGHTDSDPLTGRGLMQDNLDLSVLRATNTYRALLAATPGLGGMRNRPAGQGLPQPILSVSGYGADRPIAQGDTPDAKRRNRRIDLRFLMASPEAARL
jgi:chemotaxis protein MotB